MIEEIVDRYHTRTSIFKIRERFGNRPLVGVEIGTRYGYNAYQMLKHLNIKMLYLIDPYLSDVPGFRDGSYEKARRRLRRYKDKICFVQSCSYEVVDSIPNDLDFVYIDGEHSYKAVLMDIELYYPKLNDEGILCGHDFESNGVSRAVVEFAHDHDIDFMTSYCLPRVDWFYGFSSAKKR